jgi:hypothetical protein
MNFSGILRKDTEKTVLLGPFLDENGDPLTGLTIDNTDILISKNGEAFAQKSAGGASHLQHGFYSVTLDESDCDTVWPMKVICFMAGARIVASDFTVLTHAAFDGFFASNSSSIPAAVLAAVAEPQGSITVGQCFRVFLAALAGVTNNKFKTFRTPNGEAVRIEMTPNDDDRGAIVLTPDAEPG